MTNAIIYCDGSVSDNWHRENNKGGWGAIVECNGHRFVVKGEEERNTTNNRMELMPLVKCLPIILEQGIKEIEVVSDSQYVLIGISNGKKNYMKRLRKNKLINGDLWKMVFETIDKHGAKIKATWIKGHNGHSENEICDEIAGTISGEYTTTVQKTSSLTASEEKRRKECLRKNWLLQGGHNGKFSKPKGPILFGGYNTI